MFSPSNQGSPMAFATFRRSMLGIGSDQVHSMDVNSDSNTDESDLNHFQKRVFDQFHALSSASSDEFLSIDWVQKLLESFLCCQDEFQAILSKNKSQLAKSPLEKFVNEFFERCIKALDICNATGEGIEKIRLWLKHLDIILCAFDSRQRNFMGEAQFRRARKALMDLAILMIDEKESAPVFSHRNRSFGRHCNKAKDHHKPGHSRSLSWSVSNSWSANKQLQSMASNLVPPRSNEVLATEGFANVVFTMGVVLMFMVWVLVAAIPCQDRGLQVNFSIPRQFSWSAPLYSIQVRIMDKYKKRERKNSIGLLKEICRMEKSVHHVTDLVDSVQFPVVEDRKEEVKSGVEELSAVCDACKNGLGPLERRLREVFRKIMICRTEGLEFLSSASHPS